MATLPDTILDIQKVVASIANIVDASGAPSAFPAGTVPTWVSSNPAAFTVDQSIDATGMTTSVVAAAVGVGNLTATAVISPTLTLTQTAQVHCLGGRPGFLRHYVRGTRPKIMSDFIAWPSFTGNSTLVGVSPVNKVAVYYDATLGAPCLQNAADLLAQADSVVAWNDGVFKSNAGHVNVIVFAIGGNTDGTGGADHMACDYVNGGNIEVCASFGQSARVVALFEAELSECAMGGNVCGNSVGEALSRWCAMAISNNALDDFASAPTWAQDGMPDWVNKVNPTDQDYDSIGCGMAFLSWFLKTYQFPLSDVAVATVKRGDTGTWALVAADLTHSNTPYPAFMAAVKALSAGWLSDDPFGALTVPAPVPPPPVPPSPPPPPPVPPPLPPGVQVIVVRSGDKILIVGEGPSIPAICMPKNHRLAHPAIMRTLPK